MPDHAASLLVCKALIFQINTTGRCGRSTATEGIVMLDLQAAVLCMSEFLREQSWPVENLIRDIMGATNGSRII